jgi:hypothetical protein
MAQTAITATPGLFLDPNPLGNAPPGALAVADNCVIRYAGKLESRRGFAKHSTKAGLLSLGEFEDSLVASDGSFAYYYTSNWHTLGTVALPSFAPVPMNQFLTSRGALYVTSGDGLQRTAALGINVLQTAGLMRAAPFKANSAQLIGLGGYLPAGSAWGYTLIYQRQVGTLFDILSPPSAPFTVLNSGMAPDTPLLTVPLGPQVIVGDLVQIYRTVAAASGIPSNEFFLVASVPITSAFIGAGSFLFLDSIADNNLGAALYTDVSQEGAAQENNQPPNSADICNFLGYTFYGNTVGRQAMTLVLQGVGAGNAATGGGLQWGDTLTFNVGSTVTLTAGTDFATTFASWTTAYVLQSLADAINANSTLNVVFQASPFVAENTLALEALQSGTGTWSLQFGATVYPITTGNLLQVAFPGAYTKVLQAGPNPQPAIGELVIVAPVSTPDANFPAGTYPVITSLGGGSVDWFYVNPALPPATTASTHPYTWQNAYPWLAWTVEGGTLTTTPGLSLSSNSADPAGVSFSKFQQTEAVPLENSITVGNPDFPIYRIIPLRQSILIFKGGDGIWQLTGTSPDTFAVAPYDQTTQIAQPWSAAALGDTVCLVSTKGPVGVNESGGVYPLAPSGYDCPIREEILAINAVADNPGTMFALGYESEKNYILWTQTTQGSDTYNYCLEAWVYNLATAAWTLWPLQAQAGFINPNGDQLYYTDGTLVYRERKDYASTDFQDVGGTCTLASASGNTVSFSGIPPLQVGDYLTQGGAAGWVLSISGSVCTLVGNTGTFTAGGATFQRAITCTVTKLPWAGVDGNPGVSHRFQEIAYNFGLFTAPFLNITTTTSLNAQPEMYTILPTVNPASYGVNMRKGFSVDNTQGILLQTSFTHAAALNNFNLQSTSLVDEVVSTRTAGG